MKGGMWCVMLRSLWLMRGKRLRVRLRKRSIKGFAAATARPNTIRTAPRGMGKGKRTAPTKNIVTPAGRESQRISRFEVMYGSRKSILMISYWPIATLL